MPSSMSQKLYIEQDGDQFNDLWTACAVIFGVLIGFFLGVVVLFALRKYFPAKYTRTDAAKLAASGLEAPPPVEPDYVIKDDEEEYAGIVPQDEAYIQSRQVLDQRTSKPLSWTRQATAVDVDANEVIDGVMDALAQDTAAQMSLSLINQEFNTVNLWEEELQQQYRNLFFNLINISLDSLVQQKVIEPEMKQTMSVEYEQSLRTVEREWKEKLRDAIANHPKEQGDSMLSNDIEQLRYDATMDMEEVMLSIREQLRKDLVVKTLLKPEEIDFMEEKLVENLSNLSEIINNEYQSVEKIHVDRAMVARKSGLHYFSTKFMEEEQIGHLSQEIEKFMEDLKKTCKVGGGTANKIKSDFIANIKGIHIKYNEEFQQNLQDQLSKSAKDRISEMKRIKTWKRSTDIASTGNQSYQAAVDGLIEPSRYISTMHDLQKTVRLDRMLARKRIDTKEGEIFDGLVNHMSGEKQGEYKALIQDIVGTLKLEKGVNHQLLEEKTNKFKDDMLTFTIKTKDGYVKLVEKEFDQTLEAKKYLEKEIIRQSADQEELLGEQEDAVLEVLQTQSGLSEIEREQMMQVHQHQALSVINMLFMNRIRSMKRVEVEHLQDRKEHDEFAATLQIEMDAITPVGKAPNKGQQKKIDLMKKKHEEQLAVLDDGMLTTKDGALDALRNEIFAITRVTLSRYDERIGELLAKLQVSQARKEGTIVKQTQVLDKIKSKLVDMIWQDGYVPEANCKRVLQDHHKIVQDVSDKFATKKENNASNIEKSMVEKKEKKEGVLTQEMNEMVEKYKAEEHSNVEITEPLLVNWNDNKVNIQRHNLDMEQTRMIQDLYNNVEDDFARELHDEEHNIILELAKMGRLDANEFDAIMKAAVTACVGGDKLYKELSAKMLSKYGQTVKRSDKAYAFWEVANQGLAPSVPNPKAAAERAAGVWRARLGIYDERKS